MGLFDIFRNSEKKNIADEEEKKISVKKEKNNLKTEDKIILYDIFDRKIIKNKKEWIEEILKPNLRENWNDIEKLCSIVQDAFSKKVYEETKDACLKIYSVDNNEERKINLLGTFYIKTNRLKEAIELYERYSLKLKDSEITSLNYGEALSILGEEESAEKLYLNAIKLNNNSEIGINKYFSLLKKRDIEEYEKKLFELANIEGAWRAKLNLSVHFFKKTNKEEGNLYLVKALEESKYNLESMAIASGIYGMNEFYQEFEKHIIKEFNPEKHGPYTTLNVLEYYKVKGKYMRGLDLCKYVSKFNWSNFSKNFKTYENFFLKLKNNSNISEEENKTYSINFPLWFMEIKEPTWLFNERKEINSNLLILPFTSINENIEEKNDLSQELAISIPLYLNEILSYKNLLNYQLVFQYNKNKIKISNKKYNREYMKLIKEQNPNLEYILSGNIKTHFEVVVNSNQEVVKKEKYEINIYIYNCFNDYKIELINHIYEKNNIHEMQKLLLEKLIGIIDIKVGKDIIYKDSKNLFLYGKKIEKALDSFDNNSYKAWEYKEMLDEQIEIVLENRTDELKIINLISLLYEISKTNSHLLKIVKPIIYNMIKEKVFNIGKVELLVPIIYNIYNDEMNYNNFLDSLSKERPKDEYVDWINQFVKYVQ